MNFSDDLQSRWWKLEEKLLERFGRKPDVESILFLIGIQELGDIKEKFTKEQKQDLMHVAICTVLSPSGYYELEKIDEDGCLCFGVYHQEEQIGFARVITDNATFAYLCDVFIDEAYRGRGLSKWLMEVIINYPSLQGLRRLLLATRDAHGLYGQFGFVPLTFTDRWMQIHWPDVYQQAPKH